MNIYEKYSNPEELLKWHKDDPNNTGEVEHLKNGKYHNDDGPAIEFTDGTEYWYQNGKLHRDDGPAMLLANEYKAWYKHGQRHREDGPAITRPNGYAEWYWDGIEITEDDFDNRAKK